MIIKINSEGLSSNGIKAYVVKEWVTRQEVINCPEDDEVILVTENSTIFS